MPGFYRLREMRTVVETRISYLASFLREVIRMRNTYFSSIDAGTHLYGRPAFRSQLISMPFSAIRLKQTPDCGHNGVVYVNSNKYEEIEDRHTTLLVHATLEE